MGVVSAPYWVSLTLPAWMAFVPKPQFSCSVVVPPQIIYDSGRFTAGAAILLSLKVPQTARYVVAPKFYGWLQI